MSLRLRFLLDTNILIPLQDSLIALDENLKNIVRLAGVGGHHLLYHPASETDIQRDKNAARRGRTLDRLGQYQRLEGAPPCPWNKGSESPNDACDNEILYALACNAVHALITEDRGIHAKARTRGLEGRVHSIQTAEDWLRRLHESTEVHLPNIEDVPLYSLTPKLHESFFNSLREDYQVPPFNDWFGRKAQDGRHAWVYRDDNNLLGAICIYAIQENETINNVGDILTGKSLKLCTFKVGEPVRGRKIGELFLKAAFRYASENKCTHVFVHGNAEKQPYLAILLEEFGFVPRGDYGGDLVWVKEHPVDAPVLDIDAKEYVRRYFPHFRQDAGISKYLVPIQPEYHDILFPDYSSPRKKQLQLFDEPQRHVGNAIKLAYLCHTPTTTVIPGDILLFYRTHDEKLFTTIAVVEDFKILADPADIATLVSRRTVYSVADIERMAVQDVKVILFRLIKHVRSPVAYKEMQSRGIVSGSIMSLLKLDDTRYWRLADAAEI